GKHRRLCEVEPDPQQSPDRHVGRGRLHVSDAATPEPAAIVGAPEQSTGSGTRRSVSSAITSWPFTRTVALSPSFKESVSGILKAGPQPEGGEETREALAHGSLEPLESFRSPRSRVRGPCVLPPV